MISEPISTNLLFQEISPVIVSEIDNVNKFALITTANIKGDFKI